MSGLPPGTEILRLGLASVSDLASGVMALKLSPIKVSEPYANGLPAVCPNWRGNWAQFGVRSGCSRQKHQRRKRCIHSDFSGKYLVGGSGIEPLTPSMSRKCSPAELTARQIVMPALVAGIHVLAPIQSARRGWPEQVRMTPQ